LKLKKKSMEIICNKRGKKRKKKPNLLQPIICNEREI
jgi:hypothetical protein